MTNTAVETEKYAERPLQIIVNGRAALTIMTHAEDAVNLVYGALFTERVIDKPEDIESVISDGSQVSVVTKNPYSILLSRKTVLAGCGGASSFLDTGKLGTVSGGDAVSAASVSSALEALPASGWYAAGLFSANGDVICTAEDITAQNAADQVIGFALRNGLSLADTFAVIRGNCSVETVRKIIIAKIPVLGVDGVMTDAAAHTAEEAGLRIISHIRS